ncbi:hypothetical protein DC434_10645 [Microbacterium sp. TPD7012]|nr:hypothetical protein DC434_10645 [Microbacterium sp. TPD7012]
MMKKTVTRNAGTILGASLLLAGASIAVPSAAHAGTIVQSRDYSTQFQCNIGRDTLRVQGFNVAPHCTYDGLFKTWSFWYETK